MDSQDIRGLLKEVFLHIEQRIDSGEDYSVLETAIKGNEEMMHSSVIASLLDTRGAHGQECHFMELFFGIRTLSGSPHGNIRSTGKRAFCLQMMTFGDLHAVRIRVLIPFRVF